MSRQFEFQVQKQENLLEGLQLANINGFSLVRTKNSKIPLICIRHGPNVITYRFDVATDSWKFYWKVNVFNEGANFNSIDYPWFVGDIFGTESDIIVIQNQSELVFLQQRENSPPGVDRVSGDTLIDGTPVLTLIGNFYSDKSVVGILKRRSRGQVQMYRTIVGHTRAILLRELPNVLFSPSWTQTDTKIFLTDLRGQGKDLFVLLTLQGLEIYEFDQVYNLTQLLRTKTIRRVSDIDTLFFGNFTNRNVKDIIHLNDDGLFLYKYNNEAKDLTLVSHNTDFTFRYGWRSLFADSVKIYDFDNDGIDELLFTGTNGLNVHIFNPSLMKWENVLNSSNLQGLLQYSKVIGLVKTNKVTVFSQDTNGGLQSMNIIESNYVPTIPADIPEDPKRKPKALQKLKTFQPSSIQPSIISRMSNHEPSVLRWTEQWDGGFLKEAVRPQTGQVEFSIPLFKAGPVPALESAIGISYNSQEVAAELLGVGWTIPIADYYIAVDHKGSIFPIDYEYYLVREGRKVNLLLKKINDNSMEFEVVKQPELRISYELDSEKWIVGNDIEQIRFGDDKTSGALKIQLNWSNWKGSGTDTTKLEPYIHSWYLSERRFLKTDSSVFYEYETSSASLAGNVYSTSIRLVRITDGNEFKINFEYSAKSEEEFQFPSPISADEKIITFPVQLVQSHYLKSCNVQTSTYQQQIDFDYQLRDGKRQLVQISQPMNGNTESIFIFDYRNELDNFVMSTCKFMKKTQLSFDYTKTTSLIPPFSLQYSVNERPQIAFGSDYAVMAYKVKMAVEFRLTNLALTTPIFKGTTAKQWSNGIVQSFVLTAFRNSFTISQTTGFQADIFTFSKNGETWSETPSIETFHQLSLICYSETFYAIAEPNTKKLIIVERDDGQSKWNRFVVNIPDNIQLNRLEAQNYMIIGRGDDQLILFYKKGLDEWTSEIIDRDEIFQTTEKTMSLFHTNSEFQREIIAKFDRERLQLFNNMIVASGLQEKDGELMIVAKLYLMDTNRKIAKTFVEKVSREKLFDIKLQKESDGTNYTLQYYQSNGKYQMKIVDFKGKLLDEIDRFSSNRRSIEERLSVLNSLEGWNNFFKSSIIFNPELYKIQLCKDGLFIGDDTFLRMTGMDWQKEPRPSRDFVLLGKSFVLGFDQKDPKSVYFHYQKPDGKAGDLIKHIQLYKPGQFINRYPAYLSYQLTETKVIVQTFKTPKTLGKEESYTDEELMYSSNLTNLMTIARVGSRFEWRVRSLSNFMEKKFYSIVEKWSITNDNVSRTTAYERSSKYKRDERVVEESLRIIPGGNKEMSGWIEHVLVNNMETSERTTATNYYNALGNLVSVEKGKAKEAEKTTNEEKESNKTPATNQIFDKTGHLEISNFAPYAVNDDEGVYFGFETYEERQGVEFDVASIVRGKLAFTGESYLNLQKSARLRKILKPKDTNNIFIASCYIRSNSLFTLKSEVKYLRALVAAERIQTKEIWSKILRQSGEWFYLESYIDLITLSREHGQLQGLQITIEITSDSENFIDLDHFRFSPLTQNFEAAVFNPQGKVAAKITDSGLVSRTIFDRHNREIGTIKNNEQIEHFTRATKTGEIFPAPTSSITQQPSSKIKFEPESGFYEHFDATAFSHRWRVTDDRVWAISRGQLVHRGLKSDTIMANADLIDDSCAALRFGYNLRLLQSSLTLRWSSNISITFSSLVENQATLSLTARRSTVVGNLPVSGELLIFIEVERVVVWIDGVLIVDQGHGYGDLIEPWSEFQFEMTNYLVIDDLFIMNRPRISLEYFNGFGDKVQVLQFESDKVIQVSQTIYDELGRGAIVTKPTKVSRSMDQTLFAFYPEFVHNDKPTDSNSVLKTGLLKGDVDTLNKNDQGVPYFQTKFDNNPLDEKISKGLPGLANSVTGPNAKHFRNTSQEDFMSNLFPMHKKQAEILPNGSEMTSVVDSKKNIVARYTRVAGFSHILSTFEYDDNSRLIKILPPLYHEIARTASKEIPWKNGNAHLTQSEKKLQETYGSHFTYDKDGRLMEKRTPDAGTVRYIYTSEGSLRFMVSVGPDNTAKRVVYLFYDEFQQLVRTGHISSPISLNELQYYLQGEWLPNAVDYQLIQYSDQNADAFERGLMKSLVTYSGLEPVKEIVRFNNDFDVSSREIHGLPQAISLDLSSPTISVQKSYNRKRVSSLTYPGTYMGKKFKLVYTYDKLGNVIALGTGSNYSHFATFTYHTNGLVASEKHMPKSAGTFSRVYKYNSPGYLERISDPYLTVDISYTNGGYGMNGFGDGTILLTTYNPKWADNVDRRLFRIHDVDEKFIPAECIDTLKRLGYLDSLNNPKRMYLPDVELSIPLKCRDEIGLSMSKLVAEKQVPLFYGYRFAYGNYKELINGKYFTNETHRLIDPLQGHTFSEFITGISKEQSQEIFDILLRNKFILSDQRTDPRMIIGRRGESFFRDKDLEQDLKIINEPFDSYSSVIIALLTSLISQRKSMSLDLFQSQFFNWNNLKTNTDSDLILQRYSRAIFEMLTRNGYLTQTAFRSDFIHILSKYNHLLPEIAATLNHHFIHALGKTPFDFESTNIDANGNHRMFSTGFERYELAYKDGTNQVADVNVNSENNYKMDHDVDGNVIRAMHKNILAIEYNRTSQKPTSIRMTDGRQIMFFYDAQGERILKRVLSASGVTTKDIYYIRDDEKRVLLERQIIHIPGTDTNETTVTMFIHGPRGLIGFIRNDKFHSVITDHAGSTRLIIRDGQVVAAFDYLPYGKTMRLYSTNPQDLIAYRYTGQEFDEETGLYNYRARLYDPDIGRFYQLDPQAQYYSPYKYAGNSFLDSKDESTVKETVSSTNVAISASYLGDSAGNGRWNPGDQNFRDTGKHIGIVSGGKTNALLPTGVVSETVTQNTGGMYLTATAANGNWDPNEWKWDSPQNWNGFYQGFATGASLTGDVNFGNAVGGATYKSGVMANNGNAAFWEWDLTNADTWNAILSGFDGGIGMPNNFVNFGRSFSQLAQSPNKLGALLSKIDQMPTNKRDFDAILKDPRHPLYKVALISSSADNFANGDFDVMNWKNTFGSHDSSNGVFFARDTNERTATATLKRKQPRPEMVDIFSYRKEDNYRVRRFAMVPNDEIYLLATLNVTSKQINSTDSNQFTQDEYITESTTSGSSPVTFWPLSLLRIIKSTFYLTKRYFDYRNRPEAIRPNRQQSVPSEPLPNHLPDSWSATPGLQFDEFEDNYSVLKMGDQWLAETNMQGNLMWAFILIRKLFGSKSDKSKFMTSDNSERIELDIEAYEIVNEFFKDAIDLGVSCGAEEIVTKIIDSGKLDYLFGAVKRKLMRREYDDVAKLLFDSLVVGYKNKISAMSSPKTADLFEEEIQKKCLNLNNRLLLRSSFLSESATVNSDQINLSGCEDHTMNTKHCRYNSLGFSINLLP